MFTMHVDVHVGCSYTTPADRRIYGPLGASHGGGFTRGRRLSDTPFTHPIHASTPARQIIANELLQKDLAFVKKTIEPLAKEVRRVERS